MTTRAGFVALIGEPNAGKSTLLNRMVGAKVSIVTHKVQTTRARIRGVAMEGEAQIVFVDTPGLFRPRRGSTGRWSRRPGAGRRMPMSWCC
jgi:GTP-binding protein Era